MAMAHNRGRPAGLGAPTHYSNALRTCLAERGLLSHGGVRHAATNLFHWLKWAGN
jgi:hypothetical protein